MDHEMDTTLYLDTVCALLDEGKRDIPIPVSGTSMTPFLSPGDTVYVSRTPLFRRGDIVLFRRPDGRYVLHRLLSADEERCLLRGDAQSTPESVPAACLRARVEAVRRRGRLYTARSPRWRFYAGPWQALTPLRPWIMAVYRKITDGKKETDE